MKAALLSAALLAALLAFPAGAQEPAPTVEKLIEQLGSRSFPQRERATKLLRERGPAALPALRKALQSTDEEVRKRAEGLIPALEIDEALMPKRVKLAPGTNTLGAAIKDFGNQTGYKLALSGTDPPLPEFSLADAPFWDAMEEVMSKTGTTVSFESYQKTLRLSVTKARSPFVNVRGPFRLQATWMHEDRDVDLARHTPGAGGGRSHKLTMAVSVLPEPRITLIKLSPAQVEEATDESGNSLLEPAGPAKGGEIGVSGRGTFRGESLTSADIRLRRASGSGAKLAKVIRGTIPVKTILIRKQVVVTNKVVDSSGTMFRAGTDSLQITRVNNQGGSIEVEVAVPREDGSVNRNWQWYDRFHLEDDAGNKFERNGSGSRSDGRGYWISLYFSPPFNKKTGPPTKFVLEDWVIHDHAIPFEFKDVPLP